MTSVLRCLSVLLLIAVSAAAFADATTLWTNTTPDMGYWKSPVALGGGEFVACANLTDPGNGSSRAVVRRWDLNGNRLWTFEVPDLGPTDGEYVSQVAVDQDGTLIVWAYRPTNTGYEFAFFRLDAVDGHVIDDATVSSGPTGTPSGASKMLLGANGDIYGILGSNKSIVAFDSQFTYQWENLEVEYHDFELNNIGRVIGAGISFSAQGGAKVVRLNVGGATSWVTRLYTTISLSTVLQIEANASQDSWTSDELGTVYHLSASGAPLGMTDTDIDFQHSLAYHGPSDTLVLIGADFMTRDIEMTAFDGSLNVRWTKMSEASSMSYSDMALDKYGNIIVAYSDIQGDGEMNYEVKVFDKQGFLMWDLTNADISGTMHQIYPSIAVGTDLSLCVVGSAEVVQFGDEFAHVWRMSQFFHKSPDLATVRLGRRILGDEASLADDDGNEYQVCKFIVPNQQVRPILVDFDANFPIGNESPGRTNLSVRVRSRANTTGVFQNIQLFNWQTNAWDASADFPLSLTEQRFDVQASDIAPYLQPNTHNVKGRIAVGPFGPVTVNLFCVAIDQFKFRSDVR